MELGDYQKQSRKTAIYPGADTNFIYPALGLAGETGEVIEKLKKLYRNDGVTNGADAPADKREEIGKEIGDVLWYLAQVATELDLSLDDIAQKNIDKLTSRQERGKLHSEGDNR